MLPARPELRPSGQADRLQSLHHACKASEDALQLSQEQPSSSANGHPPQHGVGDTTPDALLSQGSQSGLDNGTHTEGSCFSRCVDPSSLSEPQHTRATEPVSAGLRVS